MIIAIMIIPLIGVLGVASTNSDKITVIKQIALTFIVANFATSVWLWGNFDANLPSGTYQFTQNFAENDINFGHFHLGVDGISLYYVVLTCLIIPISILANWETVPKNTLKSFIICFLVLETLLIAVFTVLDLILFYVFFESVLIPLFLIVGIFGTGEMTTKIRAAFLLFLYTLFGSLFMLLSFLSIFSCVGSTDFTFLTLSEIPLETQKLLWLGVFISIAVKTPIVPFNTWLTYAHSEAPVSGSIVLAGVILKLATYGILRIIIQFLPDASAYFGPLVQMIALISVIYASLATVRQTDFKKIVAYSSVAHVAVVVIGIFSNNIQGIEGGIMLSLAHGVVSPALFFLVGGVLYDRYHTRTIRYYRGTVNLIPIFTVFFFIFTMFNAAIPLSGNWIGEFMSLMGIFGKSPIVAILGSITIVLSAVYSLWLFNRISFGSWSPYLALNSSNDVSRREFVVLFTLFFFAVTLGIWPNLVLNDLHNSISGLIYHPI